MHDKATVNPEVQFVVCRLQEGGIRRENKRVKKPMLVTNSFQRYAIRAYGPLLGHVNTKRMYQDTVKNKYATI